ncbi:hypothetical protein FS749_006003 [Ceratobasidium sp. UAMH 11750]|nr:hypothetical protein FS749_006003 [Ceratobasidium sp. UAMH 11750]
MNPESSHTAKLTQLRQALCLLPASLPSGSSVYNFHDWSPDPSLLDDYGAECSVLNAHLEIVFGLRDGGRLTFIERGPGIESIVDIFDKYLSGNYTEKPVIAKWLDDLIDAAEHMSDVELPAKRTSKPSAAQKRLNEWQDEVNEEKARKKRAKTTKAEEASKRSENIAKTAQSLNWDFTDLQDVEEEKIYTGGRRSYAIVDELIIKCKSTKTGDTRYRCSSDGCQQSWASRQPQRHLAHAIEECRFIDEELRERAAEASDALAPGSKVAKLDSAKVNRRAGKSASSQGQPSVASFVTLEGRKAKQTRFDLAILNFVAAAQLPPFKLDLPEFHARVILILLCISNRPPACPTVSPNPADLANGWLPEDAESPNLGDAHMAEDECDSGSEADDDADDEPLDFASADAPNLETEYGVNLSSKILQDLLSDRVQSLDKGGTSKAQSPAINSKGAGSVKKDISSIDLDLY